MGKGINCLTTVVFFCFLFSCSEKNSAVDIQSLLGSHRITVADLQTLMANQTEILMIDVRTSEEFLKGKIPGAQNVWRNEMNEITADTNEYSSITAPKEKIEQLLGRMGAKTNVPIVIYDNKVNADAANLWWILWRFGKRDVMLLEGGLQAWREAGGELSQKNEPFPPSDFHFTSPEDNSRNASLKTVVDALSDPGTIILDVRSYEEYSGTRKAESAIKSGRVPGSIWMNYSDLIEEKGQCTYYKPEEEIQNILASKGVDSRKKIICYCQSGVRSAHTTFVLSEIMGYKNVMNFDGSWEEWSSHDELAVEMGESNSARNNP